MYRIAVIAGHSSTTAGKRTPPMLKDIDVDGDGIFDVMKGTQYKEHYANVGVSMEMDKALTRCGFEILRIGYNDSNASDDTLTCDSAGLTKRQQLVKSAKCDGSISNHFNAFGDGKSFNSADGICVYYHSNVLRSGDSASLARMVMNELIKGTAQRNRDIHSDAFAEVNCAAMGTKVSVLNEFAFMTNQKEAETMMASKLYWIEKAEQVTKAVCKYFKVTYIERSEEEMDGKEISEKLVLYRRGLPTSDYAKESSELGVKSKIFSDGNKDGLLDNPQEMLTRQDLAVVLNRLGLL